MLLLALVFGAVYLLVAITRTVYPYDLDFIEDGLVMQSLRVTSGQPIYLPPGAEFVPHPYMPLYFWIGGWLLSVLGPGYVPLRLLSLGATLATAILIGQIARRESDSGWIGVACAGLYLGGYRISGFWYDLVRVDSLFVLLVLCGLACGVYAGRSRRRLLLSALGLALAFWTKQTGVVFGIGLALYLMLTLGRPAWFFLAAFGALTALPFALLNAATDGWLAYYVIFIQSLNPIEMSRVVHYVFAELFGSMAGLSLTAVGVLLLSVRRAGGRALREQPWLMGLGLAILVSGMGRASTGGNLNNLMPAYALLCLAPALLARGWCAAGSARRGAEGCKALIATAVVIQFGLGAYNPLRPVPPTALWQSGRRLIERIASIDGEVLVLMHPYYAVLAGKSPSSQIATLWYAREHGTRPFPDDFVARIRTRYYAAIISDESEFFELDPTLTALIEATYVRSESLSEADAPSSMTGVVVRPRVMYVPKTDHK